VVKPRTEVEDALERKGFRRREGDHHRFIFFTKDGKKTPVITKSSHSMRDIGDELLTQMAKQCRLTKPKFMRLIECTLSREDYEAEMESAGNL
jgi:predicted RNA binding protein YcfA (HicA-like mRNA interferase family)